MNRQHTGPSAGFTRTELVIVLAIVAGLFALLYPAVQNARNPKGPHGETYPSTAPNEVNRVTHPTGLSIILPGNWDHLSGTDPTSTILRIAARGAPERRLKSVIAIWQCDPEPDKQTLDRCKKLRFQDFPAYEICRVERKDSFDDPASLHCAPRPSVPRVWAGEIFVGLILQLRTLEGRQSRPNFVNRGEFRSISAPSAQTYRHGTG